MADGVKPRGCMPSNGAIMLLGVGLAIPASLILVIDKSKSGVAEVVFAIAGIVFLVGFVRMIDYLSERKR